MTAPSAAQLNTLRHEALTALRAAATPADLETWRVKYLGRKGVVPQLLRTIRKLPLAQRRITGQLGNKLRRDLTAAYREKHFPLAKQQVHPPRTAPLPTTHYQLQTNRGHLHPLTQTLRRVQEIFLGMGFQLMEGPSVEESRYNFDQLNIAPGHPARAETDTYYLAGRPDLLLRTHVSPLQIRGVRELHLTPPWQIMYYGASFRAEKEDATHGAVFQQYEFMVVNESVNLADLKAFAEQFYSQFFSQRLTIRFRPSYFPFVEPGLEVDIQDTVTRRGAWLEMAGAGMVHPNVLRAVNVDPARYQGIALGGGLDRLAMLKFAIPDIRLFYGADLQFLRQF